MTSIVLRADASLSIGSGHVMRCRTLARELRHRGAEITFVCRRQPGDLIGLLEQEFPVLALPELSLATTESPEGQTLKSRELYAAWLGCSQLEDASDALQALQQAGVKQPSWFVVDHYGLDADWETHALDGFSVDQKPNLLVIDDLADRPHIADLLLDQNFFGEATDGRYAGLVPVKCSLLLGPHYAVLGSEYAQLHPLVPPRTELRRVLLFFGGVDPDNLTCRALEALMDPALTHLEVDVVLGMQSHHRQEVAELVARRSHTTLHDSLPSLVGLIIRADLAIGAGGVTTWERACLGLPSLVVAFAENQLPTAQALDQAGHLQLLGDATSVTVELFRMTLLKKLHSLKNNINGYCLTDGWGTARIANTMLNSEFPWGSSTEVIADVMDEIPPLRGLEQCS